MADANPPAAVASAGATTETEAREAATVGTDVLVHEGDIAGDYLERLLDIADLDGDIDLDVERDRAVVAIVGDQLGQLVGPEGETLDALQELTRLAVMAKTGTRSRLMLDIGGHRARRRQELTDLGRQRAEEVVRTAQSASLTPMTAFERKVVHDAVALVDGVRSVSDGVEPERYVVLLPE